METATVLGFIGGFAHWLGAQQDKFVEDRAGVRRIVAETVQSLWPATPEQMAALDAKLATSLAAANDAMKTITSQRAGELVQDLLAKRRAEIQEHQAV